MRFLNKKNIMNNLFDLPEPDGAIFSEFRTYRYVLWRIWNDSLPKVMFIGLNPSTANENKSDPTINRIKSMVKSWGYGGFYMLNLFTYITAYPEELKKCGDPVGLSDYYLLEYAKKSEKIIFAWGNFKEAKKRAKEVEKLFPDAYCLVKNKDGSPRHPLYIKSGIKLIKY
jgi:hypothetical protein